MAIVLNATSKGIKMSYKASALSGLNVPVLVEGAGIDDWLRLDRSQGADLNIGCDGVLQAHVIPSLTTGSIVLQPLSPTLVGIFKEVMQTQQQTEIPISGTLTYEDVGNAFIVTFNNFIITSNWEGFEYAQKLKDCEVRFKSSLPDSTIAGQYISIGEAIAATL